MDNARAHAEPGADGIAAQQPDLRYRIRLSAGGRRHLAGVPELFAGKGQSTGSTADRDGGLRAGNRSVFSKGASLVFVEHDFSDCPGGEHRVVCQRIPVDSVHRAGAIRAEQVAADDRVVVALAGGEFAGSAGGTGHSFRDTAGTGVGAGLYYVLRVSY